jgi:hypothetical protein
MTKHVLQVKKENVRKRERERERGGREMSQNILITKYKIELKGEFKKKE